MTTTQNTSIQPYLFFNGRCEEAIEFYKRALGAKVDMMMRFKDSPEPCGDADPSKVMHASFTVGETLILASDGRCSGTTNFEGFGLSLTVGTVAEADRFFKALSEGGRVEMPQTKTFFSPSFGMVVDRFGVTWMVYMKP